MAVGEVGGEPSFLHAKPAAYDGGYQRTACQTEFQRSVHAHRNRDGTDDDADGDDDEQRDEVDLMTLRCRGGLFFLRRD